MAKLPRTTAAGAVLAALVLAVPAGAQRPGWRLRLEPTWMDLRGHDPHVLTVHAVDLPSATDRSSAVTLDSRDDAAWRGELRHQGDHWSFGAEFTWFQTFQDGPTLSRAAAGTGEAVTFEIADERFTSTGPAETLFYRTLDDTELALWTLDLFGERTLAESGGARLGLRFGVRFADFDNDYRAVAGIETTGGTRVDAESNYGRMTGPLLGVAGTIALGRVGFEGHLAQSVVLGEATFNSQARQFTGPFDESPTYVSARTFGTAAAIAIPISELQFRARYALGRLALGVGLLGSAWWDVGVPPGLPPVEGGSRVLQENTLVLLGASGFLEFTF